MCLTWTDEEEEGSLRRRRVGVHRISMFSYQTTLTEGARGTVRYADEFARGTHTGVAAVDEGLYSLSDRSPHPNEKEAKRQKKITAQTTSYLYTKCLYSYDDVDADRPNHKQHITSGTISLLLAYIR